jgi:hypothetical protein
MKTTRNANTKQSKQGHNNIPKPEIRDNLDSRNNEEQGDKGNYTTHNKKPHSNKHPEKKEK